LKIHFWSPGDICSITYKFSVTWLINLHLCYRHYWGT